MATARPLAPPKNKEIIQQLDTGSLSETATWIAETYSYPESQIPSIVQRARRVQDKYKRLKKNKHKQGGEEALKSWLEETFEFPAKQLPFTRPHTVTLAGQLERLDTPSTSKIVGKTVDAEIKSRDDKIQELDEMVKRMQREIDEKAGALESLQERNNKKQAEIERVRHREQYYRSKYAKLEQQLEPPQQHQPGTTDETEDLRKQVIELQYAYDILEDQVQTSSVVELFDEHTKQYTPETQRCVQKLLTDNVATNRVGSVISGVLKLAGKEANRLPSQGTVRSINMQRLVIAQQQIAEELPSKEYTTIETDETSKFGQKYGAYAIRDTEGRPYVLGLRDLVTKSAKDTLDTLKQILWDIDKLYYKPSHNLASQNLLFHLRNTMSDRAATEGKFNELLESYRSEILPVIVEDWKDLPEELKTQLGRMNNFFCGLHGLVHIAEAANSSTKEVEVLHFEGPENVPIKDPKFRKASESGVCRLIRTTCKVFAYGGDAKTSCHGRFIVVVNDLLKAAGYRSLPLTPYRGNRFNILFHNACCIYWLYKEMVDFLEKEGSATWVLHDLKVPFFLAECKALGLICKLVTTPLWKLIEDPNINIIDMNERYLQLVTFLKDVSNNNLEDFMTGKKRPFPDVNVKDDVLYKAVIAESEVDADCLVVLGSVLPVLAKLTQRLYHDHLPGGKYAAATEEMRTAAKGTAKHNKYCETIFAFYDQMLRTRPHISTITAEASLMFTFNKTGEWLDAKSDEEEKKILQESRKQVKRLQKEFKDRQNKIKEQKAELQREKFRKGEAAKKKELNAKIQQANDILYWGLLQSEEQVDQAMIGLSNSEKLHLLKAQLKFRKNLLEQKASDVKLYNFSVQVEDDEGNKKRRQLLPDELAQNVKQLIRDGQLMERLEEEPSGTTRLVNKRDHHRFETDGSILLTKNHRTLFTLINSLKILRLETW